MSRKSHLTKSLKIKEEALALAEQVEIWVLWDAQQPEPAPAKTLADFQHNQSKRATLEYRVDVLQRLVRLLNKL